MLERKTDGTAEGGVGLKNIRERLNLIYGDRYTLNISDASGTYAVELVIPLDSKS